MRTTIKLLAALALAALLVAIILGGGDHRPAAPGRTPPPAELPRSGAPPAPPPPRELARPGPRPSGERPTLPSRDGAGADARRSAELEAKGVTPHKLHASRAGGRMTLLAIHARRYGDPALADAAEALGGELWAIAEPGRAGRDVVALLARQAELVARFKDLARRHPEDPFLIRLVGQVDDDLVATRRGEPRGVDRKLETEYDEGPRKPDDDDEPDERAGPGAG